MSKLSVAIADDNERMLRLLENIVSSDKDLSVVGTAKDGEAAYKLIKEKEPDVVLLDMVMPKLDGIGVMDRVHEEGNLKKTPSFLVISAVGHEQITETAFSHGADYYIMKPFSNEMVLNRIKSIRNVRSVPEMKMVNAYEKVSPLSTYEKQCLRKFIVCHQAITILQCMREKKIELNDSKENDSFLQKGKQGLRVVLNDSLVKECLC